MAPIRRNTRSIERKIWFSSRQFAAPEAGC